MNMCIYTASGDNAPFAADDFCAGPNDYVHAGLRIGITRFADGNNAPVELTLPLAAPSNDTGPFSLAPESTAPVAQAAAPVAAPAPAPVAAEPAPAPAPAPVAEPVKPFVLPPQGVVRFYFNNQACVRQANTVPHCWTKNFGVSTFIYPSHSGFLRPLSH